MTPRWLVCLAVVLATPAVHAQTAPVPAEDPEAYSDPYGDGEDFGQEDEDLPPTAPYAPPELPAEKPTARPYAGAVWASGHWYWDGSEWRLNPGSWLAPMPGYQFINGYWEQDGSGWRWVSGGWARQGTSEVELPVALTGEALTASKPPPPPQEEVRPPPPAPEDTWTPGYWYWSGDNWVWVEGAWMTPPRPDLVYVAPRWTRRGPTWSFVSGGWAVRGSVRVVVPVYRHSSIHVSWGHPHYFPYAWHRYPVVHHYRHGGWRGPRYHHHDRSWRGPRYHHRDRSWRGPRDHHHRRHHASPGGSHHRRPGGRG